MDERREGYGVQKLLNVIFSHLVVGIVKYTVPTIPTVIKFDKMAAVHDYAVLHLQVRKGEKTRLCDIREHFKVINESADNHLNDKMFSTLLLKVVKDTLCWNDMVQYKNISVHGQNKCRVYVNLGFVLEN